MTGALELRGAPVAKRLRARIDEALARPGVRPCLVNVVGGADEASLAYLDAIDRSAAKLGILSRRERLPEGCGTAEAARTVARLGADPDVHGIMLQTPLPSPIDARALARALPPDKDVDGAGPASLGAVLAGEARHVAPCTAAAVIELLLSEPELDPAGRHVVIVGRSLVVGRPLAAMLAAGRPGGQATVTLCHTRTRDLSVHTRRAEILVVAAGVRGLIKATMVAPGAIVVDVGTHPVDGPDGPTLVGDVDPEVAAVAGRLTPVPGGVGPVTNMVLMQHVTAAARPGVLPEAW